MTKTLKTGLAATLISTFALALSPLATQAAPMASPLGFNLSLDGDAQIIQVRQGRGGDDGAGHDAGDDRGGRRGGKGRGADDGAGHDAGDDKGGQRGGKGRGADDAPGDDNGGKGRGRGRDDGPNHT